MLEAIHKALHAVLQPPKEVGLSCQVQGKDRNIYKVGSAITQVSGKLMDILRKLAKYTAAPGEEKLVDAIDKLVNRKKLNK
jgi:hypothetical protein